MKDERYVFTSTPLLQISQKTVKVPKSKNTIYFMKIVEKQLTLALFNILLSKLENKFITFARQLIGGCMFLKTSFCDIFAQSIKGIFMLQSAKVD